MQTTRVLVRVQAKGGKFIGPDGGYSLVTVRAVATGQVLAQGVATGGSGALSPVFTPSASRSVIVTPQAAGDLVQWLSAPAGQSTAGLLAEVQIDQPTLVRFSAQSLTNGIANGHSVSQQMWLTPGVNLVEEPGVVLVMPGLDVQILAPNVSAAPTASLDVTAWVAMMCGCKIDPTLPWLPTEFSVTARVTELDGSFDETVPLAFQSTSTFGTATPIALPGPGNYALAVDAVQSAEGNVGSASAYFSVAPPAPPA
jgi:hypothetical protein